jgi:uncharacterized membrane protein
VTTLLVILAVAAGTYVLRVTMLVALADRDLPARFQASLPLVAPAAIATLVAGALGPGGGAGAAGTIAVIVAFLVVRRTSRVLDAFTVGLPLLWVLTVLGLG